MHTCDPPKEALEEWLTEYPSVEGRYGHLLLEQATENSQELIDALRPYFESAHLDARAYFHDAIGIELHPDATGPGYNAQYPSCLPKKAIRGIFGELMAGLVTESYKFVGEHEWRIPVFLFRYHADIEPYLFQLARDPERDREIFGRFGDDFLGIVIREDGSLARVILGEAKWRTTLTQSAVETLLHGEWVQDDQGNRVRSGKGIWYEINRTQDETYGLRQLQKILREYDCEEYSGVVTSIGRLLIVGGDEPSVPRTDLILLVGNDPARREKETPAIDWENMPAEYTAGNDLQVVEIYLNDGAALIDELYGSLWLEESPDAD